jgi:hypothetical protein
LELIEAEDIAREEYQHDVDAHREILDDIDQEQKDGLETVIGIVVFVGVVFHVSVEIYDKYHEHPCHEYTQKSAET